MAKYTSVFKFYLPEVDDSNKVYAPGFTKNFEVIDNLLTIITSSEVVNVYGSDPKTYVNKKVITDQIVVKYQSHIDSWTNTTNGARAGAGIEYINRIMNNPHATTPSQLFYSDDINSGDDIKVLFPTIGADDSITYNPYKNMGHNSIVHEINDTVNSSKIYVYNGKEYSIPISKNVKINGYSTTYHEENPSTTNSPAIDFTRLYLQDIGQEEALTTYDENNKYRNHKYIGVTSENQVVDNYVKNDDFERNKHVSNHDVNHFESHIKNRGHLTHEGDSTTYPGMMLDGAIDVNPHRTTASQLYDHEHTTDDKNGLMGKNAIVKEINRLRDDTYFGTDISSTKIHWDVIDKGIDGDGANITDIPNRNHNDLRNIQTADVTSDDEIQVKHVSNAQTKKWEEHVDSIGNTHKIKASQLNTESNVEDGRTAILEQINLPIIGVDGAYDDQKVLWNAVDKENIDGLGNKANITHIPLRKHDDLQSIGIVNTNTITDYTKNKHTSNPIMASLSRYLNKSYYEDNFSGLQIGYIYGKETGAPTKIYEKIVELRDFNKPGIEPRATSSNFYFTLSGFELEQSMYLELTFKSADEINGKNIDIFMNDNYLGQVTGELVSRHALNKTDMLESNKLLFACNNCTVELTNFLESIRIFKNNVKFGRNAVISEINRTDYTNLEKIKWSNIETTGSSLDDVTSKNHWQLTAVNGYDIDVDPTDIEDTAATKNKHISHDDGVRWDDHLATQDGSNPHKVEIENILGEDSRSGRTAVINVINAGTIEKPALEDPTDKYLMWNAVSKYMSSIADLQIKDHDLLTSRHELNQSDVPSSSDYATKNKHLSNEQAVKWESHVDDISTIQSRMITPKTGWSNPHKVIAASLFSHKAYPASKIGNGGNAIIDAINDYADISKIDWEKINMTSAGLPSIPNRKHNDLQEIGKPAKYNESSPVGTDYTLHISQEEYNYWEEHRFNNLNPHQIKAHQIMSSNSSIPTGSKSLVYEINTNHENPDIVPAQDTKLNHTVINFEGVGRKYVNRDGVTVSDYSIDPFNITKIPFRSHADLQSINQVTGEGGENVIGHVSNKQVLAWDSHMNSTDGNPHGTKASQIKVDITQADIDKTEWAEALNNQSVKDVLVNLEKYRGMSNSGLVKMERGAIDDHMFYFDEYYNLYIPQATVYFNTGIEYTGKLQEFKTPVNGPGRTKIGNPKKFSSYWKINAADLPKNKKFFIFARLTEDSVVINVETDSYVTEVTNGRSALLMYCFLRTHANDPASDIVEGFSVPSSNLALGLPERMLNRLMYTQPYTRQSGLNLKADGGHEDLSFLITAGSFWDGLRLNYTDIFYSNSNGRVNDNLILLYRNANQTTGILEHNRVVDPEVDWIWEYDTSYTHATNKFYQNPQGGLSPISPDGDEKIVCNIIYYDVVYDKVYMMLSEILLDSVDQFELLGNAMLPNVLPGHIQANTLMVGILLCSNKDNVNFARIYGSFDILFTNTTTGSTTQDHTSLVNLNSDKFYHFTKNEYLDTVFVFNKELDSKGEDLLNNRILNATIDNRINSILTTAGVSPEVDTITKIANMTVTGAATKVDKAGDTMTGSLFINITDSNAELKVSAAQNMNASFGLYEANKKHGFEIEYNGESDSTTFYARKDAETRIPFMNVPYNSDYVTFSGTTNLQNVIARSYLHVDTGMLPATQISTSTLVNTSYGLILGNHDNKQGAILLKHNGEQHASVVRVQDDKFNIDGYGAIYLNTDLSRLESDVQDNPADPQSLKLIDANKHGIYDVYVGNIGTQSEPVYPIRLAPKTRSNFTNGIHVGGSYNADDVAYIFTVNGTTNFNENSIDRVSRMWMTGSAQILFPTKLSMHSQDTYCELEYGTSDGSALYRTVVSSDAVSHTFNGKQFMSILGDRVTLHAAGSEKIVIREEGLYVAGPVYSDDILLVKESRAINTGAGLSGGGSLAADKTISLVAATHSAIGGVIPSGDTFILGSDGSLTAKALKSDNFNLYYDSTTESVVIKFV